MPLVRVRVRVRVRAAAPSNGAEINFSYASAGPCRCASVNGLACGRSEGRVGASQSESEIDYEPRRGIRCSKAILQAVLVSIARGDARGSAARRQPEENPQ